MSVESRPAGGGAPPAGTRVISGSGEVAPRSRDGVTSGRPPHRETGSPPDGHPGREAGHFRAAMKASTARSTSSVECAAESWTRIRALPCGTTG